MKFLSLLILTATLNNAIAQDLVLEPFNTGDYLKSYYTNGIQLVSSPLHWQKKDWLIAGGTVAIGTGLYLADVEINKPMKRWQASSNGTFDKIGHSMGPKQLIAGSLVALGTGIIAGKPGLTSFAQDNLQAQLYTGGICFFAKVFFGRRVPDGNNRQYWAGPFEFSDLRYQSFFSGHTSVAFATATSIYLHSGKKWWVGVLSYGIASGIGVSRLQRQAHWASDAFVGAVVGTAVSSFVYHQNEKKRNLVTPRLRL